MFDENQVAVVTGGTRGIGRSVSLQLAEHGVAVVATYYSDEDAASTTEEKLATFDQPTGVVQFDVGDQDAVETAFSEIREEFGSPDILVNNAGTMINSLSIRMSPEEWDRAIQTNLSGAFYCSRESISDMLRGDGGAIVNVSSVGALHGWSGQANYAASKSGLLGMTRSLAREVGSRGIRVNAICPGYVDTQLLETQQARGDIDREQLLEQLLEREDIPQDRVASPDEVANAIVFLASEQASYVNGSILRVDGGLLA